jgi:preprotein translocase subunit Sec61beta
MSEKQKSYLPQSGAGLIRYFDVEEQVKLKPEHVLAVSIIFGGLVLFLKVIA